MRFPIITKRALFRTNITNLSGAVQESLADMKIIEPSGKATQKYFDLAINQGPLLECLESIFNLTEAPRVRKSQGLQAVDGAHPFGGACCLSSTLQDAMGFSPRSFTGEFHAGCTEARRPPSFSFFMTKGNDTSIAGGFGFHYTRTIKLSAFLDNDSCRNDTGHRDLEKLAQVYNNVQSCDETLYPAWGAWTGGIYSLGKVCRSTGISLEFAGNHFKGIRGINDLHEKGYFGPLNRTCSPLYQKGQNTGLSKIAEALYQANPESPPYFVSGDELLKMDFGIGDALCGLFQIAGKIFPTKIDIAQNEDKIREACSGYTFGGRNK